MAEDRRATVIWEGDLGSGSGRVSGATGAFTDLEVSFARRAGEPQGTTSPEELIAGAHASCYAMALSGALAEAGNPPERLEISATATFDPEALKVTAVALQARGSVPGLGADEFRNVAERAERACPVSNALRGNVELSVEAELS